MDTLVKFFNLPALRYKESSKQTRFVNLAADKLSQLPGVSSVSGISAPAVDHAGGKQNGFKQIN
jgi:hypothetical protein